MSVTENRAAGRTRTLRSFLDDLVTSVFVILLLPLAIIVVGAPIALLARLVIEIARRM
jgi:hypothetical protein